MTRSATLVSACMTPLSHQNVFCCFLSLASSEAVPWGGPSLGSRWRRLQKSLELLDSTVSHGPKALPYAIRRDGEETGWDVCKGTCVITMLRQAVKLSLRGHPCPLPAQSGARTPLSLPAVERAGPRVVPRGNSSRLTRADSSA